MKFDAATLNNVITTVDELRAILRPPRQFVVDKCIDHIDEHCRAFIERSPFALLGTADGTGSQDISPKGDPAGFVQILDERTLAIPDRPGNHRADTLVNIIENPRIGMLFLVPGVEATLRVNGDARVVADQDLLDSMAVRDRSPKLAIVVDVKEAFLHCTKCVVRSNLWTGADDVEPGIPSLSEVMVAQIDGLDMTVEEFDVLVERDTTENLY